jgi:hypothetical protein
MAFCPKCSSELESTASRCANCGYDFPMPQDERKGWAYSSLADFSLVLGQVMAGLMALLILVGVTWRVLNGDVGWYILGAALGFFLLGAVFVVFARVQRL